MFDLDLYFQGQIVFRKIKFSIFFSFIPFGQCHMDVANVIEISHRGQEHTVKKIFSPPLKGLTLGDGKCKKRSNRMIQRTADLFVVKFGQHDLQDVPLHGFEQNSRFFFKWRSRGVKKNPMFDNFLFLQNILFL